MQLSILSICFLAAALLSAASPVSAASDPPTGITNVKDFGAVGDGQTDDTIAVQNAMKNAQSETTTSNAIVYFPLGNYKLVSNVSSTFEFAFFFQQCDNDTNAVSFVGEVDENGTRTQITWLVDQANPQAFLFKAISCPNFAVSSLDIQVNTAQAQTVIASVEYSAGLAITNVHFSTAASSPQAYAIALSIQSVSNVLLQNAVLEGSHTVAVALTECTGVTVLHATIRGSVSSNNTNGISVEGGSNQQFESVTIAGTVTGFSFWSEVQPNAVASISHSSLDVTSVAIYVDNDINLSIDHTVITNNNTPAALYGMTIGRGSNPCISIGNSTFSNLGGAAIQNVYDSNVAVKKQRRSTTSITSNKSSPRDNCPLLTIEQTTFEYNKMDLEIQGSNWELLNNVCYGNDVSELTCLGSFCNQSNNQDCDFTSDKTAANAVAASAHQPRSRSSPVILREM